MPKKLSAGIVLYRKGEKGIEVFLVHPGGPFWAKKDDGAWSIPKGEYLEGEDPLTVAKREFYEETGTEVSAPGVALTPAKQPNGKVITAWAVEGEIDPTSVRSNTFSMEWPKGSGVMSEFPEIDRAAWFSLSDARTKIVKGQIPLLEELAKILGADN